MQSAVLLGNVGDVVDVVAGDANGRIAVHGVVVYHRSAISDTFGFTDGVTVHLYAGTVLTAGPFILFSPEVPLFVLPRGLGLDLDRLNATNADITVFYRLLA